MLRRISKREDLRTLSGAGEMWKNFRMLACLSVALAILCLYLAYHVVDQSVSLEHARASQRSLQEERDLLRKLTFDSLKAVKRVELESLLAARYSQSHVVRRESDVIFVDEVGLRFRGDELVEIVFMSDQAAERGNNNIR